MITKAKDGNPTQIFWDEEGNQLAWDGDRLATREEYELADRTVGSIFESLHPGENIQLDDGYFILDDDLDLIQVGIG